MSKTHKRALFNRRQSRNKRRQTRNNRKRKSIRNYRNKKMMGGAEGECPVCLEYKQLLKMQHSLDDAHPTAESESAINHEMCEECFMRLNPKNCPLCRRPVEGLINTDDNRVVWPIPPRGPPIITSLMTTYLNQMPPPPPPFSRWRFPNWAKHIRDNDNPFFQQFYDVLSELPDVQLIEMYKNSLKYSPLILGDLVRNFVDYSNNHGQKINAIILKKTLKNIEIIKAFLTYMLLVEVSVGQDNYFNRIAELFGW